MHYIRVLPDEFSSQRVEMKPDQANMIVFLAENVQSVKTNAFI